MHQLLHANRAVGAAAVLDIDLLAEPVAETFCGKAGDEIGAAARWKRADHFDRPRWLPSPMFVSWQKQTTVFNSCTY